MVDVITGSSREEAAAAARRWDAVAELADRRCAAEIAAARELWSCDGWDSAAAEIAAVTWRSHLVDDPDITAAVDADLASAVRTWGSLGSARLTTEVDALIERHDPDAVIVIHVLTNRNPDDPSGPGDPIGPTDGDGGPAGTAAEPDAAADEPDATAEADATGRSSRPRCWPSCAASAPPCGPPAPAGCANATTTPTPHPSEPLGHNAF